MKPFPKLFVGLITLACSWQLCACSSSTEPAAEVTADPSVASQPAPVAPVISKPLGDQNIQGINGESISLTPDGDNLTVLTVWAPTWFDGSNAQLDQLIELHNTWQPRHLRILCLAYDVPAKTVKKSIAAKHIPFTVGTGNPGLYDLLELEALPTYWILDSKGNVVATLEGYQSAVGLSASLEKLSAPTSDGTPSPEPAP